MEFAAFPGTQVLYAVKKTTKQTQKNRITFEQHRPSVEGAGPMLFKCYTNVLCLLGSVGLMLAR